mmetsp:Transcript_47106/g.134062  ORF Transcript_47106/g.134062 Transcript_47106/m.134062 type:complete len:320 (-) Transcript_47106:199-1158(-)
MLLLANIRSDRIWDPVGIIVVEARAGLRHVVQDPIDLLRLEGAAPGGPRRENPGSRDVVVWVARIERVALHGDIVLHQHLLGQVQHVASLPISTASLGHQRSEATDEEVRILEGHQVGVHLPEIGIQRALKAEARGQAGHAECNYVVHLLPLGHRRAQRLLDNILQRCIVVEEALVGVLQHVLEGQGGVVRLQINIADARSRDQSEGLHDALAVPVKVVAQRLHQQPSEPRPRPSRDCVCELNALQAIASLSFLPDQVQHTVGQVRPLRVEGLGITIAGPLVVPDYVLGPVQMAEGSRGDGCQVLHVQIDQHTARHPSI